MGTTCDLHQNFRVQSCYKQTPAAINKHNRNMFNVAPCLKVGIQKTKVKQLTKVLLHRSLKRLFLALLFFKTMIPEMVIHVKTTHVMK